MATDLSQWDSEEPLSTILSSSGARRGFGCDRGGLQLHAGCRPTDDATDDHLGADDHDGPHHDRPDDGGNDRAPHDCSSRPPRGPATERGRCRRRARRVLGLGEQGQRHARGDGSGRHHLVRGRLSQWAGHQPGVQLVVLAHRVHLWGARRGTGERSHLPARRGAGAVGTLVRQHGPDRRLSTPRRNPKSRVCWSGCRDLNPGPPRPERGALTKLRYSPLCRWTAGADLCQPAGNRVDGSGKTSGTSALRSRHVFVGSGDPPLGQPVIRRPTPPRSRPRRVPA